MENDKDELLTPDEASKFLKVEKLQIYRLIKSGKLPALNVGSGIQRPDYRILKSDIMAYLKVKIKGKK